MIRAHELLAECELCSHQLYSHMLLALRIAPACTMPQGAALRIPQELVDFVIGHLQDDRPALKSCSETCVSMMLSSSKHLLRRISLHGGQFDEFLSTIRSSTRLPSCVVELFILDNGDPIKPLALYDTFHSLPHLDILVFEGNFSSFPPNLVLPPTRNNRHLSHLTFTSLQLNLIESVLEAFHFVDCLDVSGEYIDGDLHTPRMAARVKVLTLDILPAFFCNLSKVLRPSFLKKVFVQLSSKLELKWYYLEDFLQIYGQQLEELALALPISGLSPPRQGTSSFFSI
jgi:hypothetical protein